MTRTFSLLALILAAPLAHAQDATPLAPGQTVERDLAADGADAFALTLDASQFVLGHAFQRSVDVVVTVTGPDGETVRRFDDPARGPELFSFTSDAAGVYTVTVTPFEPEAGRYAITIERVEPEAATPEGLVRQQFAALDRPDSPGAVVAVIRRGEVVFGQAFGMASLTHDVPYTLDTPTNIGSTSKQFTAFALVLLQERGELDLDDDVRAYIPELPDFGETVTLRHLLTHTTGYRAYYNLIAMTGREIEDDVRPAEIIEVVQRQPKLQNAPGTEWNYNNTAYGLAVLVVERVTGETFPDWMRANVFEPLGMTSTRVRANARQIVPGRAEGYVRADDGTWREARDLSSAPGAGAVYTTARDLARWMDNTRTGAVGGLDAVRQLGERYVLADGDTTDYGLGLFVGEWRGLRRLDHGGADVAHRSLFWSFPEIASGLMIHTNSPTVPGSAEKIAEAFFAEHLAPEPDDATDFDPADFDPDSFDAFAGRYEVEVRPGFTLVFTYRRDGDRYVTQVPGRDETEMVPVAADRFRLTTVDAEVTFHAEPDGSVERITHHQEGRDYPGTRLPEATEPPRLGEYVGRYVSDEIETAYTVAVADSALTLYTRRFDEPVPLAHKDGDAFTGPFPITTVDFERDASGAVTGFRGGNGRSRDVWFARVD